MQDLSTLSVDTLTDENDGSLAVGDVSLREAIAAVEDGGTITFAGNLADEDVGFGQGVIGLSLGELAIDKSLTIKGLGSEILTISGNNQSRVFLIDDGRETKRDVTLQGLTISEGNAELGGGIFSDENLTVSDSQIINNSSGIRSSLRNKRPDYNNFPFEDDATLVVQNSVIVGNQGAGISGSGTLDLTRSRVSDNEGAGVAVRGLVTVVDSELTDNADSGLSTDILFFNFQGSEFSVANSVISGNGGGGIEAISVTGTTIDVVDSVIADNVRAGILDNGSWGAQSIDVEGSSIENNGSGVVSTGDFGAINLSRSIISGNAGVGVGALYDSTLNVFNSSILENKGIGIIFSRETVVRESTIAQNKGGGIARTPNSYLNGSLSIRQTTIADNGSNTATVGGILSSAFGSFRDNNSVIIDNSTITGNTGTAVGGVDLEYSAEYGESITIRNTIIAGNTGPISDVAANVSSLGYNLIGSANGSTGFNGPRDLVGSDRTPLDPKLGPLKDNGGTTLTRALLPDSPAIDAGNPIRFPSLFDQRGRGFSRVLDGNGDGQARADIGAFEAPASMTNAPSNLIKGTNRQDNLFGTNGDDIIQGFNAKDFLKGKNGNDILEGGSGNDTIIAGKGDDILGGGQGRDILKGGRGRDAFVYQQVKEGRDIITDFTVGEDVLDLSAIFADPLYNSSSRPFETFVRLGQDGRNTRVNIRDISRANEAGGRIVSRTLAVLNGVSIDEIDVSSFVA